MSKGIKQLITQAVVVFVAVTFIFALWPIVSFAETRTIVAEGYYNMGDSESLSAAYEKARMEAKRAAVEQAGTYVESYSQVKNYRLTEDEVRVVASGVIQVKDLDKKAIPVNDGLRAWIKIEAKVNSDDIDTMRQKLNDRRTVEDYKKLQRDYTSVKQENEALKRQLREASSDRERAGYRQQLAQNEKKYWALIYIEKGLTHFLKGEIANAGAMLMKSAEFDIQLTASFSIAKTLLGVEFFLRASLF